MINESHFNTPITVMAAIDDQGHISPKSFVWQGKQRKFITVGRQWEDKNGRHVLVESANGDRFEIELSRQDLLWYLKRVWQNNLFA